MSQFHTLASNLLSAKGFNVSLFNYDETDFDIESGEAVRSIESSAQGKGKFTSFKHGEIKEQGYNFFEGDKKLLLNVPLDFNVSISTSLLIKLKYYKITHIEEIQDVLDTVLHKVYVREDADFIEPV